MRYISFAVIMLLSFAWFSSTCYATDASTLSQLVGFTIVAASNTTGEFDGADFGKVVKLDNGMIFEFHEYDYFYDFRPDVIVFAKKLTLQSGQTIIEYELLISDEDEVFDVTRIR